MRINDILVEFAPSGDSGGSGDYFQALASAWYNGTFDSGSLQKGIKSQQDVEQLLQRGIIGPDGVTRKYGIDYNSTFDGVVISSDDYYEHADHDETDSRTGKPFGPYDYMEFSDEQLDEATGDEKFDSMLSRMTAEPKYPDQDMPPTSIAELIQWADRNNKPYHEYFAQWARRNGFKNVNDALVWFGDNVDPSNPWGPKDFLDPFGRPAAEELEDAAKHDPKAAELMKVFRCYEEIVFDWPDEYRQMNMPVSRKGTDESLTEFAPDSNDGGGEDDALRNYARMWWAGDEATQMQIERALAKMGWEIGEDEGGYDNGGVFVVRAGDINGNSYTSWSAEDLTEGVAEATGDEKFDTMMGQIQREPKYPDSQMPPTDVKDLYQWAVKNNKPYHKIFAEWANREGYKSVAPALQRAGDLDTEALDYWTPRIWKIYWGEVRGIDSEMPPEWSKKRVPDELRDYLETVFDAYDNIVFDWPTEYRQIGGQDNYAEGDLNEKSTSQAQFRTMAAAAHDPKFAKKVGIKQSVAREFNRADTGQDYKDLPKKATEGAPVTTTPGSIEPGGAVDNFKQQMANNTERDMAEGNRKPEPPEADYGDDYQDMVKRVKKLAGLGPLKTQYDPNRRVYRNMPTAVQPRK